MRGFKILYRDGDEEKTAVVPFIGNSLWDSVAKYNRNLYDKLDENDVIAVEETIVGESCDHIVHDGYRIYIDGDWFTLHEVDEPGLDLGSYKDSSGNVHEIREYTVTDEEDNLLDCTLDTWMDIYEMTEEIDASSGRPRQRPNGDLIIKRKKQVMMTAKIGRTGGSSLIITITEQAKALGLGRGDLVKVTLERVDEDN